MTDDKRTKLFMSFLLDNEDILYKYLYNRLLSIINEINSDIDRVVLVAPLGAFSWRYTAEGDNYWADVNAKWGKYESENE